MQRERLPDRFDGWDSHNSVALAFDANGLLHVAANMHASKLNYFRAPAPDKLPVRAAMTGRDDDFVTYPQFLKSADGPLLFIYRAGRSGDGAWKVNRWDGRNWATLTPEPFLSESRLRPQRQRLSIALRRVARRIHSSRHCMAADNRRGDECRNLVCEDEGFCDVVRSERSRAEAATVAGNDRTRAAYGPQCGLLNNAKVSVDARGRPAIVFTRYDKQGRNTVELMVGENGSWRNVPVATAERATPVRGTGSLGATVALAEVDFSHAERPALYYRFPDGAGTRVALEPATLAVSCTEKPSADIFGKFFDRPIPTMRPQLLSVGSQATLVWAAQPANNDRQPDCTPTAPLACKPPPSTLKLLIDQPTGAP